MNNSILTTTTSARRGLFAASVAALLAFVPACGGDDAGAEAGASGETGDGNPGQEPPAGSGEEELCDAGNSSWVQQVLPLIQGRKPESRREIQLLSDMIDQLDANGLSGRAIVARGLASGDRYIDRWETFFYEQTRVNRIETKVNVPCYGVTTGAADGSSLAEFIRDNDPATSNFGAQSTMQDVLRSSLLLDDMSPYYRADLFARMANPLGGANVSAQDLDQMRRTNYGEIFESAYMGRKTSCLECHNSDASVTYNSDPLYNRHWAIQGHFEKAVWGEHTGRPEEEFFAAFRWNGFADTGSTQPWGMSGACGSFTTSHSGDLWNWDGYLGGALPSAPQLFDIDPKLRGGFESLALDGLMIGSDDSVPADQSLAYLTAATIANAVWKEALGNRLVVANNFPRNDKQREILQDLTEAFVEFSYSQQELLVEITTHPYYNQAPAASCAATSPYNLEPVFDPFSIDAADPNTRMNSVGDAVHRHSAWVLLDSAAQSLWWDRPQRFGPASSNFPQPNSLDFLESQGVFVKDAIPGFNGVDFYGMLFWEQEMAAGNDPFLNGACTGPLSGGCAPTDFINALMSTAQSTSEATAKDVVIAVKDRLLGVPSISDVELPFVEDLVGVSLSAPILSLEINTFEVGVRRYAGLLLNTPQYMLSGVALVDESAEPLLVVDGTSLLQLCEALGADILPSAGETYSCSDTGITID